MRIPRIYQNIELKTGAVVNLSADAANHLTRVLRLPLDAEIKIFNGQGGEYAARIISITKQQTQIKINKYLAIDNESPLEINLAQALVRGEKMDYIIQKAVELGVAKIMPVLTERCEIKLSAERTGKRLQHWQAIIINACEQCGRNCVPTIAEPVTLAEFLVQQKTGRRLVLDPTATTKIRDIFQTKPLDEVVTLLIGPEGGLSNDEIKTAKQQGFAGVNLGPRILRTETAGLAAISALQNCLGDL